MARTSFVTRKALRRREKRRCGCQKRGEPSPRRSTIVFAPGTDISDGSFHPARQIHRPHVARRDQGAVVARRWRAGLRRSSIATAPRPQRLRSRARKGFYWAGRAASQGRQSCRGGALLEHGRRAYPGLWYYGQLALSELGKFDVGLRTDTCNADASDESERRAFERRSADRARCAPSPATAATGSTERAFFEAIADKAETPARNGARRPSLRSETLA